MDGFMDDFTDLMLDTLTVAVLTAGEVDPNTGAGTVTEQVVVSQPCSDQDLDARTRAQLIVNGVAGTLPVSRAYTRWFPWPEGQVTVRVNGRVRPVLKQGPPTDSGGQGAVYVLELGPPQDR